MPGQVAILAYVVFVFWLFAREGERRSGCSHALWIPVIWLLIIASKSPSTWFADFTQTTRDTEGNPLDLVIFSGLPICGLLVLVRRRLDLRAVIARNKWLFVYFLYEAISLLWSDQALRSVKLWMKDAGNVVMVLVILSEENAAQSAKSTILRASYILVTLSLVLVKYLPDLGRVYDYWTHQPRIIGASPDKNSLGATLLVCALGLLWSFFQPYREKTTDKWTLLGHSLLMIMVVWLLLKSQCATALGCAIIGAGVLLALRVQSTRSLIQRLGLSGFIAVPLIILSLHLMLNLGGVFLSTLGRDETLTARTKIWQLSLQTGINPLIGTGYCSFWHGERAKSIGEALGFFFDLKEAHNGYLEAYLNGGLIGLSLLLVALATAATRISKRLSYGEPLQVLRFTFLIVALIYNASEAAFAGLHQIWFVLLLALIEYPARRKPMKPVDPSDEDVRKRQPATHDFAAAAFPTSVGRYKSN